MPLRLNMANNNPSAHLNETVEIEGYTHDSCVTASMATSRIDCIESEIMELFNEYEWIDIRAITVNGEAVEYDFYGEELTLFL